MNTLTITFPDFSDEMKDVIIALHRRRVEIDREGGNSMRQAEWVECRNVIAKEALVFRVPPHLREAGVDTYTYQNAFARLTAQGTDATYTLP